MKQSRVSSLPPPHLLLTWAAIALASCGEGRAPEDREAGVVAVQAPAAVFDASSSSPHDAGDAPDGHLGLPTLDAAHATLCDRPADDAVRDVFCLSDNPSVAGLRELAQRLKISALPPGMDEGTAIAIDPGSAALVNTAVFLGHSTALSGHLVSPINPRAILLNRETFIAFQRGVQKVEIITRDRNTQRLNFYLLSFKQACNGQPSGCLPGDLFTLNVERDWTSVTLEDDEDLKNTPSDCRLCHQRGTGPAILLMRELRGPWTHFFAPTNREGEAGYDFAGGELVIDYDLAKGSESYAGIPAKILRHTTGGTLQLLVNNFQPLVFEAPTIEAELAASEAQGKPRRSATWDQAYAAFRRGEQLALPYFEARATDPRKQAALSDAYARYRRNELAREQLPDLSDIHPDDPQTRAEIGLATEPGATPSETLIQACGACHNDVLDQTLSRARFNIALGRMTRAALDLAVARIELPSSDPAAMPPAGARQIEPEAKKRLLAYLRQSDRPEADDAQLDAAAKAGMAVPRPAPRQ